MNSPKKVLIGIGILMIAMPFTACSKSVQQQNVSIYVSGEETQGIYSGQLSGGKPEGEGIITIGSGLDSWTYEGSFSNGVLIGEGKVTNYNCNIIANNKKFSGTYTGPISQMIPEGSGTFLSEAFTYTGDFDAGIASGNGEVVDFPYAIKSSGNMYNGAFTGTIDSYLPSGSGTFTCSDPGFKIVSNWKAGEIIGKGTAEDLPLRVEFQSSKLEGSYSGDIEDGLPSGQGVFTYDTGAAYGTYEGEWKNSVFDGLGKFTLSADQNGFENKSGTFKNGVFSPTPAEFIVFMGQYTTAPFEVSDSCRSFISEHEEMFPCSADNDISQYVNINLSYNELDKSPSQYAGQIVTFKNYRVIQARDYQNGDDGPSFTYLMCCDKNNATDYIAMYTYGVVENILRNDVVNITGMFIDDTGIPNVMGGETHCLVIYPCIIEK